MRKKKIIFAVAVIILIVAAYFIIQKYSLVQFSPSGISFVSGYNSFSIPYSIKALTAEDFLKKVNGNAQTCTGISQWNSAGQYWESHPFGSSINNFQIKPTTAYLIYCTASASYKPTTRSVVSKKLNQALVVGYNFIGVRNGITKASWKSYATGCSPVNIGLYDSSKSDWVYTTNTQMKLSSGGAYFLNCAATGTWDKK